MVGLLVFNLHHLDYFRWWRGFFVGNNVSPTVCGSGGLLNQGYTISNGAIASDVIFTQGADGNNSCPAIHDKSYGSGGNGGNSYFGGSGRGAGTLPAKAGRAFGAGGGGSNNYNASNATGGNGANGVIIFSFII